MRFYPFPTRKRKMRKELTRYPTYQKRRQKNSLTINIRHTKPIDLPKERTEQRQVLVFSSDLMREKEKKKKRIK
jgi:hypothetical protein